MGVQAKVYLVGAGPGAPERGTTSCQRNIVTSLEHLQETVERHATQSPAEELDWFMPWAQAMELKYA